MSTLEFGEAGSEWHHPDDVVELGNADDGCWTPTDDDVTFPPAEDEWGAEGSVVLRGRIGGRPMMSSLRV